MKDFIPKGTGNSRYMKTSLPTGTTWEQALAMLRAGTFPFDLNGVNSAGVAQMGDGLNTATFWPDDVAAAFGLTTTSLPKDGFEILAQAALYKTITPTQELGTIAEGETIWLNENGIPVEFYVAKQDYEPSYNTDRVLVVRKDAVQQGVWNASGVNTYDGSTIDTWFNQTYLQTLDSDVQAAISTTNIPATSPRNSGVVRLNKSVFALSMTELGRSDSNPFNSEGTTLPVFSTLLSSNDYQATRTPRTDNATTAFSLNSSGVADDWNVNLAIFFGYRPAFTLPSSFTVVTSITDGLYDILGNLLLKLPGVQIATGSYVGTGTYGSANPNTLTFEFEPKLVIVRSSGTGFPFGFSAVSDSTVIHPDGTQNTSYNISAEWSGKAVTWYSTYDSYAQYNASGTEYYYIAIG